MAVVGSLMAALVNPAAVGAAGVPLPNSMAAAGDSITRAFDVNSGCLLHDCPQFSWATGDRAEVGSQYLRILARNPAIAQRAYNDARTGSHMADLDGQLFLAALQQVDYVTIAMGSNDVCTSSPATMTPTATLRAQAQQAVARFAAARPHALIYMSSIPNVYNLWSILHNNGHARWDWWLYKICQSLLSLSNTEADRQAVLAQTLADNTALAGVCGQFANCRWDNLAAFAFQFTPEAISTVDYFHPGVIGQSQIATLTWNASFWSGL
jgi:lysophospholipase L1-like esterase